MMSTPLGQRKVAIPRLQRSAYGHSTIRDRRRVSRACTACRSHKIKCTGERPHCQPCETTNRECVYIMPRKDRLKVITDQCRQMARLLKDPRSSASTEDSARITDILFAVEEETSELRLMTERSNPDMETHGSIESIEFSSLDQHPGPNTESLDLLDEDLHRAERARATGFIGKNSEVQWLRTVALAQAERPDEDGSGTAPQRRGLYARSNDQADSFSYWADGDHVDVDFLVDPCELPQPEIAERLLQCYMLRVHDSFPILPRRAFQDQFRKYFTALQNGNNMDCSPMWQGILNLVFAIGAKHSHLVKASWRADERDHLIYQARARAFGLSATTITNHSDLLQIQALGLLAFYWLTTGQVSRAWTIIGVALRFAYSLGLHVRNEDPSATVGSSEKLVRTWWSLYSLEQTLSIITGRPSIIIDSCCSVPLPIPVPEERISDDLEAAYRMRQSSIAFSPVTPTFPVSSSIAFDSLRTPGSLGAAEANSGSYFRAVVQLSIITQNILASLYSGGTKIRLPEEIQQETSQLGQRMDQWVASLPAEFNFQETSNASNQPFVRERVLLGFQLCSARILLTRPCLTGRRESWGEASEASFVVHMADNCVEAAKTIVAFLTNESRPGMVHDQGPWWCLTHHVMQAISVFLLALSYPSATSHDGLTLMQSVKKAIRWLQVIQDPVAERAYHVALSSLEGMARRYSVDVLDNWNASMQGITSVQGQVKDSNLDGFMPAFLPEMQAHLVLPTPFSAGNAAMASHAAYGAVMTGTALTPHHDVHSYNESYYVART